MLNPGPAQQQRSQRGADDAGQHDEHCRQRGQAAELLGHQHGDGHGRGLRRQAHQHRQLCAQRPGDRQRQNHAEHAADRQGDDDRPEQLLDTLEMSMQRHRQGHGGRPQQHGDQRSAVAVARIVEVHQGQCADHQQHAHHDRLQHQPAAAAIQHQRQLKGDQGQRHGKQRMDHHRRPGGAPIEYGHA